MKREKKKLDLDFPPLRVDIANAQAWHGEQQLKFTPKAFAVLHYLSEHPGQLVTKDELMQRVWADTVVTDGALAACIRELRKVLSDDAQNPQYIETVHRRGYRFLEANQTSKGKSGHWGLETRDKGLLFPSLQPQISSFNRRRAFF